jgi:transposase
LAIDNANENKILKSYYHGDTYALLKIAKKLNIESILDGIFKEQTRDGLKRSTSLLLVALQRVCKPGSKTQFESWFESTSLPDELEIDSKKLTSQHFWDQMSDITDAELMAAEDAITREIFEKYQLELEKIALDYTNYFSFIDSSNDRCEIAKRGRNKQKRHDLRQYSMALITSKDVGLPLCSHIYEGNVSDKTEFLEYYSLLKKRIPNYNPKTMTLVFDGGSNTKENLNAIETHYICSFSMSYCKELYDIPLSEYDDLRISNTYTVKSYRTKRVLWNSERDCVLTYSKDLFNGQVKELNNGFIKLLGFTFKSTDAIESYGYSKRFVQTFVEFIGIDSGLF